MMRLGVLRAVVLVVAILFAPAMAIAQSCTFTISDLNFGSVDTLSPAPTDFSASLGYSCSGAASERILVCPHLGEGSVTAGPGGVRRMASGMNTLSYQLYHDASRSIEWGAVGWMFLPPPIEVIVGSGGSTSGSVPIYGRAFGGQSTVPPALGYTSTFAGASVAIRYRGTPTDSSCADQLGTLAAPPTFDVMAAVDANCRIETSTVDFGSHGVLRSNVDGTGIVSVTCTPATAYEVHLDGGAASASPTARKMSKGTETVTYGLYKNSSRDQPWGDPLTAGSIVAGNGIGVRQDHTVYGRVPPQTTPSPGVYIDTVVVTIRY